MTKVVIKTVFLRKPILLEESATSPGSWTMSARGFLPLSFDADNLTEAVSVAMSRITSLIRDPSWQPRKRQALAANGANKKK